MGHTARAGLVAHIDANKAGLGIGTVKVYSGELTQAVEDRNILLNLLPAAFVIMKDGARVKRQGEYEAQIMIVSNTNAMEIETAADDALLITESVIIWLEANMTWIHGGKSYQIDLEEGIYFDLKLIEVDFTVYRIVLALQEV